MRLIITGWDELIGFVFALYVIGFYCYRKGYAKRGKELETDFDFDKAKEEK